MTNAQWFEILYPPFAVVASFFVLMWFIYKKPAEKPVKKPRVKRPHKSRSQRRMEREIYRRAIDAGASEAEAHKAVRAYAAKKALNATIL